MNEAMTLTYKGQTCRIKVREYFGPTPFAASIDAECTVRSERNGNPVRRSAGVSGYDSPETAIKALEALIANDQAEWVARNPHWGEIPDGVRLGEAIERWDCDLCGGVTHETNVPGARTCAKCGQSWTGIRDRVSRRDMERWATDPDKAAALDAIGGMFT